MEVNALEGIISVAALVFLIYGPWQWYCTDLARQKLFMERAQLFDLAYSGVIAFDDPAYVALRTHIERLIRFAHNLTWLRLIVLRSKILNDDSRRESIHYILKSVQDVDVKARIESIYDTSGFLMLAMMVLKSPLLFAIVYLTARFSRDVPVYFRRGKNAEDSLRQANNSESWLMQRTASTTSTIRAEAEAMCA